MEMLADLHSKSQPPRIWHLSKVASHWLARHDSDNEGTVSFAWDRNFFQPWQVRELCVVAQCLADLSSHEF